MPSMIFKSLSPIVDNLPETYRIHVLNFYKHRKILNINNPLTFNEKIHWRKIYDRKELFAKLVDKIAVKDYIYNKGLNIKIPEILWSGTSFSELDSTRLPRKYVLKSNHASGTNLIVDGFYPTTEDLRIIEKRWKEIDISKTFVEWAYQNISFTLFAEEYIDFGDLPPDDYKFFVFDGRVEFIQMDVDRFSNHKRSFFDRNWRELPFELTYKRIERKIDCPENLNEMIILAEKISDGLDFIRVDLYSNGKEVYFGECTLYPGGGFEKFSPRKYDSEIGKLWKIP